MDPRKPVSPVPPAAVSPQEQAVLEALRATPYGSVEVVLHQSRIVQVVRTEKVKLDPDLSAPVAGAR
ncbi:DUF2292 domain-containing protein [Arenimonas sp. MALMAid1274]|uniref:DUF2292 domain-containing protein n=1 Tax=Arenimonas sp. MALMAid1274 TaxID=3411630 RepID=UPI003B9E46FB